MLGVDRMMLDPKRRDYPESKRPGSRHPESAAPGLPGSFFPTCISPQSPERSRYYSTMAGSQEEAGDPGQNPPPEGKQGDQQRWIEDLV